MENFDIPKRLVETQQQVRKTFFWPSGASHYKIGSHFHQCKHSESTYRLLIILWGKCSDSEEYLVNWKHWSSIRVVILAKENWDAPNVLYICSHTESKSNVRYPKVIVFFLLERENDVLVNPCFSLSLSSSQTPVADGREKQAKKRYDEQLLYLCYRNGRHQGTVHLYEACVNHTTVPTGLETVRVRWAKTLWVWPFSGHVIGGPCQCWWEPITDESCPCPFSSCFRLTHWYVS